MARGCAVHAHRDELELVSVEHQRTLARANNLQLRGYESVIFTDIDVELDRLDAEGGRSVVLEVNGLSLWFSHPRILWCTRLPRCPVSVPFRCTGMVLHWGRSSGMRFANGAGRSIHLREPRRSMYAETIDAFIKTAERQIAAMRESPLGFFVASMLAGAYVGIGIILIFGIALTLVVIAGAELFTGHTMFMALRGYRGIGTLGDVGASWAMTWTGNLAGSLGLAARFARGGGGGLLSAPDTLVMKVAAVKMNASGSALFARAILCNWLVCLAIWMAARVNSDSAKCIVIFWCLLAFIASGFEHSVANMTLLGLALAGNHPESVSLAGFAWNLAWVTAGNAVGGAIFVAGAYYISTYGPPRPAAAAAPARAESK